MSRLTFRISFLVAVVVAVAQVTQARPPFASPFYKPHEPVTHPRLRPNATAPAPPFVKRATSQVHTPPFGSAFYQDRRAPVGEIRFQNKNATASHVRRAVPPAWGANAGLTTVKLTYYWVKYQKKGKDEGNVELRSCDGKTVFGTASKAFASELRMEGTGHLLNGKMLNLGDCNCGDGTNTFNCFMDLSSNKRAPWGWGVNDIPLQPWSSVANNDDNRKVGSVLYAPDFDGMRLPNGQRHNGCLKKVDAIGRGGTSNHIDFFSVHEELAYNFFMPKIKKDYINVQWDSPKCREANLSWNVTPNEIFNI